MVPGKVATQLASYISLKDIPGSWAVGSKGDVYKNGQKVSYESMRTIPLQWINVVMV